MPKTAADTFVVLDFETSGISPKMGDRAIEIGAVKIESGQITDRFQQLINPGFRVNGFIESYTGISNQMLADAPCAREVMPRFADFIDGFNLVAHNASFDQRFLDDEFERAGAAYQGQFACSMLVSRRVFPDAPNHKLGTLVSYRDLPSTGVYHRALADAEMTGWLWLDLLQGLAEQYGCDALSFAQMQKIAKAPKARLAKLIERF